MKAAPNTRSSAVWFWLAASGLMLGEFLLFDRMTSLHHAGFYPRWNDQIQYLAESYTAYQQTLGQGLWVGLKAALSKTALQGTLHDFSAVLVFWLAGSPSRSAALSLNMLVFLAWQGALLAGIPRLTGSRTLAWLGFALLVCLAWPWTADAGSAVDFRLDHAAMCLMGITSIIALLTEGFRSTRWSLLLGLAIGVTVLERFLTGVYFGLIFIVSVVWVLVGMECWPRLRYLLLAGGVTSALTVPLLWVNRQGIYTYYWVGHISGAEGTVRSQGFSAVESAKFIFGHLLDMHLGHYFLAYVGLTTAVLALLALFSRRPVADPLPKGWLFFSFVFLLLPAVVLGVHRQKSAYVLGILVPGAVLLLLWVWTQLWQRIARAPDKGLWRVWPAVLACAAVAAGECYFVRRQLEPPYTEGFVASARQVNDIADYIFESSRAAGITNPNIAIDQVVDYFDAPTLQVICFERRKVWVPFVVQLPNSILTEMDENIFYKVKLCDFVMLTDQMPGGGYWPYDRQMRRLYPELKAWCEAHLSVVSHYTLFGRQMTLYRRPVKT